jgi:hypothetical protein
MARDSAADALLIADFSGAAGLLGAFQPAGKSGEPCEVRGICGGRSAFAGEGTCALFACLADAGAWLGEENAAALGGARLLNRFVRGVLAGLTPIGVGASYPGRDFVAADGRRVAQISVTRADSGALVFQTVFARARAYTTAERAPEFPGLPPLPAPGTLGSISFERLASALERGFASRFSLELEPRELSPEEERAIDASPPAPLVEPELASLSAGPAIATPIGELRAHVSLREGALERVRLRGDWIAVPARVRALEESLAGLPPDGERVREVSLRWLGAPENLVVGVTDPLAIAEAVAGAARAWKSPARGA